MAFTMSNRQAGVTRSKVAGLVRHEFRDVDKRDGRETAHSNETIAPERTAHNVSVLYHDGAPIPMHSSAQIIEELDRRLAGAGTTQTLKDGTVRRRATRKDAAVVRDIIIQLDPEFTGTSTQVLDNTTYKHDHPIRAKFRRNNAPGATSTPMHTLDEQKRYLDAVVDEYATLYGAHNLLASSIHMDEKSPHMHLLVTPIDEQGRVRQKSFIPSGRGPNSAMSAFDKRIRARLIAEGYDCEPAATGGSHSHLSVPEYKKSKRREEGLDQREHRLTEREKRLDEREQRLQERLEKARTTQAHARQIHQQQLALLDTARTRDEESKKRKAAVEEHYETTRQRAIDQARDDARAELGQERFQLRKREYRLNKREQTLADQDKALKARESRCQRLERAVNTPEGQRAQTWLTALDTANQLIRDLRSEAARERYAPRQQQASTMFTPRTSTSPKKDDGPEIEL